MDEMVSCPHCGKSSVMNEATIDAQMEEWGDRVSCIFCGRLFDPMDRETAEPERERSEAEVDFEL